MANLGEFIVVYDILPELAVKMEEVVSQVVRKAAFKIQFLAAAEAPVDTGFLKNSIYVVTDKDSTYSEASAPEKDGQELLPEVEHPRKAGEAIVAVGASYGIYQEYGTSHVPAHPYLTPAAEAVRPEFLHALELLEEKLAESVVTSGGE